MKETTSLEIQLRSWKPRQPSAGLKIRLFRPSFHLGTTLRWLAPVAGCALLAAAALTQQPAIPGNRIQRNPMVAVILSNQSPVAPLSNCFQVAASNVSLGSFEWTNRSGSTSSMGSFSPNR